MIANTRRFFVAPELLREATAVLTDRELVHQLQRVLRLRVGDRILLLDGAGRQSAATISEISREQVGVQVAQPEAAPGEPTAAFHVYAALIRPERYEWLLQKAVELGAASLTPVISVHTVTDDAPSAQRMQRWQRIVREAAEQSCRGRLPQLRPALLFGAALEQAVEADLALVLEQQAEQRLTDVISGRPQVGSIALISGPEGGLDPHELRQAEQRGIMPVTLGRRVLRAETAPLAALALLSQHDDS